MDRFLESSALSATVTSREVSTLDARRPPGVQAAGIPTARGSTSSRMLRAILFIRALKLRGWIALSLMVAAVVGLPRVLSSRFVSERRAALSLRRAQAHLASREDRKSTRLNSSHMSISYAVFCLKKKKKTKTIPSLKKKKKKK